MRLIITLLALLGLVAASCGDDDDGGDNADDEAQELEEDAEDLIQEGGARAAAETVRASLVARNLDEDEHLRDVAVLEEAIDNVPGGPEVSGLDDGDGDGRDDDGRLQLKVGDESACVAVSEDGQTVDVEGGACS